MSTEPPPAPPIAPERPARRPSRPWWQFSLRSMFVAMTAFAAICFVAVTMPILVAGMATFVAIGVIAGGASGALVHGSDRARIVAVGAILSLVVAWMWNVPLFAEALAERISQLAPMSWRGNFLNYLTFAIGKPIFALLTALTGGFVALKSAPHWHRWATSNRDAK